MHFKQYIKGYRILYLVTFFFLSVLTSFAQKAEKVLFVGNSYTYFWNLPQTVETMVRSLDQQMETAQSTSGGTSWLDHWEGNKNLKSQSIIKDKDWDLVVLQNHSRSTLDNLEQFNDYGERFIKLVAQENATPILYMTWAREFNPLMQSTITAGYLYLAEKHKLDVVPVGLIWEKVRELRPDLKLYDPDQSHPSPIGTYLTGLAFTKYLTGKDISPVPNRLISQDYNGEKLYLNILPPNDADFLKEVVQNFDFEPYLKSKQK